MSRICRTQDDTKCFEVEQGKERKLRISLYFCVKEDRMVQSWAVQPEKISQKRWHLSKDLRQQRAMQSISHALDFAFGDLCQECPGFDLGCGAVHSLIMPWEACWQGWVDGGVLLNYFLANFWEKAFPKCHNTVIFEKWTEPRCLIGQGHSQFLLDKYLVARRLYLNEKYRLRKLLPSNSCRGQDPIPSGKCLRTTPKLTLYSLHT